MTLKKENIDAINTVAAVLESGNSVELPAIGYSMFPTFLPGDRILVKPVTGGALPEAGSVVVYKDNGGLVLHRLLRIVETDPGQPNFITRGDSMTEPDNPFTVDKLIGVAVKYKRAEKEYPVKVFLPRSLRYTFSRRLLWFYSISKKFAL